MTNLKHQDNTLLICKITMGFPGGSEVKNLQFDPWVGKIPEGGNGPIPVLLPGESHGQRSLAGYSPRGRKRAGHD